MQPKPAITFWQRGLPGVLCIVLGLGLCFVGRNSSPWPAEAKHLAYVLALVLAVGGAPLVSSYAHQRPWHAMRNELLSIFALLGCVDSKHKDRHAELVEASLPNDFTQLKQ